MADRPSVRLFEIEPDLARFLSAEDRAEAADLTVPVVQLGRGTIAVEGLIEDANAFGAIVVDGILLRSLQIGDQVGLRLLGPGDVIIRTDATGSSLRAGSSITTEASSKLALLGTEILVAAHRWPRLVRGLVSRCAQQSERIADQLVICQLPRVEDRIKAIMWQLAETWGYVTSAGTVVPLTLTHETLGGLIGARRSTVTLALGRLAEQGALIRSSDEWLLLEQPVRPRKATPRFIAPAQLKPEPRLIASASETLAEEQRAALRAAVVRLREDHERARNEIRDRLHRLRSARARSSEVRQRVARDLSRRRAPSS